MALEGALGRLFVSVGADISDFTSKMSEVKQQSDETTRAMQENYKKLGIAMVAIGGAITGFGALSVKNFMDVGDQLD